MTDTERKQHFRTALTIITVFALVVLAYAVRHQISDTLGNLGKVNTWWLLMIIPIEGANYFAQAKLYQGLFRILGERFRLKPLYRLGLELNFVNNIFPSGGVTGFSYLRSRVKDEGVSTAKSTLVQLMRFVMMFVSFQILLVVGLLALAIGGQANDFTLLVSGSIATLLVVLTLGLTYIIGSKSRINSFFTLITRLLNRLIHVVRPKHPETINIGRARITFDELHENYMQIRRNFGVLKRPLAFALLANATEILAIYSVYMAFGQFVNPGAVILAYAVANVAGLVSVLPGGVGIYEALMTGVLAAGGVPAALSLPVTVMYRVLSMLVQLPPGYYFYNRALHADQIEPIQHTLG